MACQLALAQSSGPEAQCGVVGELCRLSVGSVDIVQDVATSCGEVDVTMQFGKHALGIGVVEITSQDEEGIRVAVCCSLMCW